MGIFLHTVLFPGGDELKCRTALQRAAQEPDFSLHLDGCRWHLFDKGPAALLNDGCCGYEDLAKRLSSPLPSPVMVLYIYDDDYWGYFLYQNGMELDRFASLPDYFEPGSPPDRPGNAPLLARIFSAAPGDIEPYLLPWPQAAAASDEEDVYACEGDFYAVNDSWQMTDFMEALGFDFDLLAPPAPAAPPHLKQPAPPPPPPHQAPPPAKGRGRPVDTPILPDALNSRPYALQQAEAASGIAGEAAQLMQETDYQSALPLLSEAIKAYPGRAELYLLRAFCYSQLEGLSAGMSRRPDMDRDLGKALELDPDNIMALRARCPTAATTARYKRHIEELTRLMALDEENRDYYQVSRAYRHHWVGDDESAKADLRDVLSRGKIWTVDLTYLCQELGIL